jgi:SAM-dependent methyltransferase
MDADAPNRWLAEAADRSRTYDRRWEEAAAAGQNIHGEADFVEQLGRTSVLDAGCGTGRVAIELARREMDVVGVDVDASMLERARAKDPALTWVHADLAGVDLGRTFDVVVMAGNVMIFLAPGTEAKVVANLARHLAPARAPGPGHLRRPRRRRRPGARRTLGDVGPPAVRRRQLRRLSPPPAGRGLSRPSLRLLRLLRRLGGALLLQGLALLLVVAPRLGFLGHEWTLRLSPRLSGVFPTPARPSRRGSMSR